MAHLPPLAQLSTAPVFNTKAVAHETSVPADTFRAWERRYGVPHPQRTAGGHRLYSERDIAIIRWLRDRTEEGMNISQAVMLLESVPMAHSAGDTEARAVERLAGELVSALTSFDAQRGAGGPRRQGAGAADGARRGRRARPQHGRRRDVGTVRRGCRMEQRRDGARAGALPHRYGLRRERRRPDRADQRSRTHLAALEARPRAGP